MITPRLRPSYRSASGLSCCLRGRGAARPPASQERHQSVPVDQSAWMKLVDEFAAGVDQGCPDPAAPSAGVKWMTRARSLGSTRSASSAVPLTAPCHPPPGRTRPTASGSATASHAGAPLHRRRRRHPRSARPSLGIVPGESRWPAVRTACVDSVHLTPASQHATHAHRTHFVRPAASSENTDAACATASQPVSARLPAADQSHHRPRSRRRRSRAAQAPAGRGPGRAPRRESDARCGQRCDRARAGPAGDECEHFGRDRDGSQEVVHCFA
jgi:hypothetical protein